MNAVVTAFQAAPEVVPPIDPMERRIYALEQRIVGLTRIVERAAERQAELGEEIGEALDRVYRVLDTTNDDPE